MVIDAAEEDQFFTVNLDITFPRTPCSIISFDVVDVTGVKISNIRNFLKKTIIDKNGKTQQTFDSIS